MQFESTQVVKIPTPTLSIAYQYAVLVPTETAITVKRQTMILAIRHPFRELPFKNKHVI